MRRIEQICRQFDIPIAATALQFSLGDPIVASVVPGMGGTGDVERNLHLISLSIPVDFWSTMRSEGLLNDAVRTPAGPLAMTV